MKKKKTTTRKEAPKKRTRPEPVYTLHLISDATGGLASHMVNAVLTQFPGLKIKQVYHVFKREKDDIEKTVKTFRRRNHLVFHALLDADHKKAIRDACVRLKIPHLDLTGSLVQFITDHTGTHPVNEWSRLHSTDAGYFQRIEAMEFTAQHDDSRRLDSINEADIIVVGLSRVSKSPTSTFLGSMGYKVANVSITRETGFPAQLNRIRAKKIIALTAKPRDIHKTRQKRFENFGKEMKKKKATQLEYYDLRAVVEEVVWAEKEYRKRGYPILDITDTTVEQVSAKVLRSLGTKRKHMTYH